jgi:hypothetical protein
VDEIISRQLEQADLVRRLEEIAMDGAALVSVDHDETHTASCWRRHERCAILLAASLLDGWVKLMCAEHGEFFLTPDCPKCLDGLPAVSD